MTRIATALFQQSLTGSIQRAQAQLAASQQQLGTGKKSDSYSGLGTDLVRNLSAHSAMSRDDAYAAVGTRVGTTLSLYAAHLGELDTNVSSLRQEVFTALGRGDATGLQSAIESAFSQFRNTLNATEDGLPLFAGGQTDGQPFTPSTVADTLTTTNAQAFASDGTKRNARLADGLDLIYGVDAETIGGNVLDAFRTLAATAPFDSHPTAAQLGAMRTAMDQLDAGLSDIRNANADIGRKQAQVENLTANAEERGTALSQIVSRTEDIDLATVASDIAQRQAALQASYSVFSKLSSLSLASFLS